MFCIVLVTVISISEITLHFLYLFYIAVDFQAVTVLAKQLVNLRKQKTKTYAVGSRVQAIGTQGKVKFTSYTLFFSARCNIYISHLCYDVSVRLSVTEVHWHVIANLGFKFRSKFTAHFGHWEG